jgi:hypothetical protein
LETGSDQSPGAVDDKLVELGLSDFSKFAIGSKSNALYFNRKRVQTEAVVVLSANQSKLAWLAVIATILSAASTIALNGSNYFWPKPPLSAADSAALTGIENSLRTISSKPVLSGADTAALSGIESALRTISLAAKPAATTANPQVTSPASGQMPPNTAPIPDPTQKH